MNETTDQTELAAEVEDTAMQLPARAVNSAIERAKTATDMRVVEVNEALAPAYAKASTLELTDEEVSALMAPFPDTAVDIRPHDGLIYISHIHISDRLNQVFRPGKWALLCRRHWLEGQTLYGEYILLIRGCFIGESVGGHNYVPSNPKTNYSDSLESTAAEALRRIAGKRLSCGSQVWHRDYAEHWVATYAEQVHGKWHKKAQRQNAPPASEAGQRNAPKPSEATKTPPATKTPSAASAPLTTAERRAKLVEALKGFEREADIVFLENALILDTESFTDISDFTLERIQPSNLMALIKEVKQRKRDGELPDEQAEVLGEPAADRSWESGVLPFSSPNNPVARAGMTLKELFANPATSKYAYGLCMNFRAETRTSKSGKTYEPTAEDIAFDKACRAWRVAHGKE